MSLITAKIHNVIIGEPEAIPGIEQAHISVTCSIQFYALDEYKQTIGKIWCTNGPVTNDIGLATSAPLDSLDVDDYLAVVLKLLILNNKGIDSLEPALVMLGDLYYELPYHFSIADAKQLLQVYKHKIMLVDIYTATAPGTETAPVTREITHSPPIITDNHLISNN